ncbi:MAG: EAL domain-containing protein [Acidimicrobiia bacterium]|jgi:diguanylate cyclase (GGDEF)-like protein/PAS domain S-box-containing protein
MSDREQASERSTAVAVALEVSETAVAGALEASETAAAVALRASETAAAVAIAVQVSAAAAALQANEAETEVAVAVGVALEASEAAAAVALEASEAAVAVALEASEAAAAVATVLRASAVAMALDASETAAAAAVVAALEASEIRLRELVARSVEMISIVEPDGRVVWTSPAVERVLGYPPEIAYSAGFLVWDVVHPDYRDLFRARFAEAQQHPGVSFSVEGLGLHADGMARWLVTTITDLCDDPAIGGIVLNVQDVTLLRGLAMEEAALARLGQRALSGLSVADLVGETVAAIVEVLDVDLVLHAQIGPGEDDLLVRASAGRVGGPSDALPIGAHTHWGQALATADVLALPVTGEGASGDDTLRAAGIVCGMTVGIAASGKPFGVLGAYATTQREFRPDETAFLRGAANVVASAIERRRFEDDLEYQMLHDRLTGLPNRMLLEDRLALALRRRERRPGWVAVLLIDLDDFKVVNDSLGHGPGDVLLQNVAARIGGALGPTDTLARFGGDEFVVVVETETPTSDGAIAIAERVFAAFQTPFQVTPEHELFVTVSIGIALRDSTRDDVDPATLISEADLAMYRAKRRGGNTYHVFDVDLRTRVQARLDLASALRQALDLDEFHLAYQPEIDLATGRIMDVEALLRWGHPHDGPVAPDAFLDTAEQTGLIVPIGEWVITRAFAQAASWHRRYGALAPERIFVNLSARQLLHPDLGATVEHALETAGLDPSHIGFEVTEHVFIDDLDAAAEILGRLHDNGYALSLDDFGTGYCSLTYLRRLPFDHLKIDKSFVDGLADDCNDDDDTTAIVAAIIDMAHDLRLVVTAEGVEDATQAATLTLLGCDRAQGYHYSQPVSADAFAHLIADNEEAGWGSRE